MSLWSKHFTPHYIKLWQLHIISIQIIIYLSLYDLCYLTPNMYKLCQVDFKILLIYQDWQ